MGLKREERKEDEYTKLFAPYMGLKREDRTEADWKALFAPYMGLKSLLNNGE